MQSTPRLCCQLAFVIYCITASSHALSQEPDATDRQVKSVKKAASSSWNVTFTGNTGFGQFQDIQVPVNEQAGLRADGKSVATENADHIGMLLQGEAGLGYKSGSMLYDFKLNVMQMNATTGPAETQSSSYSRYVLGPTAKYLTTIDSYAVSIGADAEARRSTFSNVSNGHYIESILIGLNASIGIERRWLLEGHAGMAPVAHFGFSNGKGFRGDQFKSSTTDLAALRLTGSFDIRDKTWLCVGVEQEKASVQIADVSEYDDFGLGVSPTVQKGRSYDLATTTVTFGFRKEL